MEYREEITGLRAVAVLSVIFYHAGFLIFSGGFIGVDIFFVISGYLITSIIINDLRLGKFSLMGFYDSRIRRILPALLLVLLISSPLAWFILLPNDLKNFSKELSSTLIFSSNIIFWRQSNYFNTASELDPLIHTWSLSVEEQFYLLFPCIFIILWRFSTHIATTFIIITTLCSLALAQRWSFTDPIANFYLLPPRIWEIGIGSLVAITQYYNFCNFKRSRYIELLSAFGFFLIVISIFIFDKTWPLPSLYGLFPTIGTALILKYADKSTITGKILSTRILVGFGLISYSLYLIHQPLLAFVRNLNTNEPSGIIIFITLICSVLIAFLSWRYIESPIRLNKISKNKFYAFSFTITLVLFTLGVIGFLNKGFVTRFSLADKTILNYSNYDYATIYGAGICHIIDNQTLLDFHADCSNSSSSLNGVLVWGDSHAAALAYGMRMNIPDVMQYTTGSCQPLFGVKSGRKDCEEINKFVLSRIEQFKPDSVLLHSDWFGYRLNWNYEDIEETITRIKRVSSRSKIYIVGSVPHWVPTLPARMIKDKIDMSKNSLLNIPNISDIRSVDDMLQSAAIKNDVIFISVLNNICTKDLCPAVIYNGTDFELTAWDSAHLTSIGSLNIVNKVVKNHFINK